MSAFLERVPFLGAVFNRISFLLAPHKLTREEQQSALQCPPSLLEPIRTILESAPRYLTIRQFLYTVLRGFPVGPHLEEARDDLAQELLKASGLRILWNGTNWIEALDLSCKRIANQIEMALGRYLTALSRTDKTERMKATEAALKQLSQEFAQEPASKGAVKDGPAEAGVFGWKGDSYEFSKLQWRLLNALYERGDKSEEWVLAEVFGKGKRKANALAQLQSRTNARLAAFRIPLQVYHPESHFVSLKSLTQP